MQECLAINKIAGSSDPVGCTRFGQFFPSRALRRQGHSQAWLGATAELSITWLCRIPSLVNAGTSFAFRIVLEVSAHVFVPFPGALSSPV